MPGNFQLSPDMLADEVAQAVELGLGGVILFGIPEQQRCNRLRRPFRRRNYSPGDPRGKTRRT